MPWVGKNFMKIVYIIDSHPENGGAPISACSIAEEVSKVHEVSLVLPSQNKKYITSDTINYIELKSFEETFPSLLFKPLKTIRLMKYIKEELLKANPDIVHVHMPRAAWAVGLLHALYLLPKRIGLIYTDREHMESYRLPLKLLNIFLIKFQYNKIICLTNLSQNYWNGFWGKATASTIPNYAGRKYETYSYEKAGKIKKIYNIAEDSFTVMFSGRMSKYKNWNLAKKIILKLSNNDIHFIIAISTATKVQLEEYYSFKTDIENSNAKCLFFHNASQSDMSEYYYLADIFVLTSNKESFGRTAIEAMSRKCVVIGRDVGGLPEVIGDKDNILGEDEIEFCNRIKFYKNNPETLENHKEWFFSRFQELYTIEKNIDKHLKLYNQIFDKGRFHYGENL